MNTSALRKLVYDEASEHGFVIARGELEDEELGEHPIVGTWLVQDPNAPFPYHLSVFNADGTMQQANPDAGDPRTSDSDGERVWQDRGDRIEGRWVELTADRTTHKYAGRLEVTMQISVRGDYRPKLVRPISYSDWLMICSCRSYANKRP